MDKFYCYTFSLCAKCRQKVKARIIEKEGQIYLEKFCPQHGISYAMICADAEWYRNSRNYIKPGQSPLDISVSAFNGCPDSCGLCPQHQQHTCLPVIEITDKCDLKCPICLKSPGKPGQLTSEEFANILEHLFRCEGEVNIINISGGEPTLHPQLGEFLNIASQRGVMQSTVSTNGLSLLHNREIRRLFKETGAIAALQFDGFRPETYLYMRGRDLAREKLEAIRILEEEGINYSLVAAVARHVNDIEILPVVDFFFRSKALSLMFQPVAYTGRATSLARDERRVTIPDVISEIEKSRHVQQGDFNPLPCSHFSCFALSYYLKIEEDNYLSLKEFLGTENYLDVIANKALPGLDKAGYSVIKDRIYDLWSAADASSSDELILRRLRKVLIELNQLNFSPGKAFSLGTKYMKAIFIHQFMDADTVDFARLMKCCNQYPQKDGRLVPMCAQNIFFQ